MVQNLISVSSLSNLDKLLLRLREVRGIGNVKLWNIISSIAKYIEDWSDFRNELSDQIINNCAGGSGIDIDSVTKIVDGFAKTGYVDDGKLLTEMRCLFRESLYFGCRYQKNYFSEFLSMKIPPVFVSITGFIPENNIRIGIVGTRKMTDYGRDVVSYLINVLRKYRCTILTGFADGIDWTTFEFAFQQNISVCGVIPWCLSRIPDYKFDFIKTAINKKSCMLISEYDGVGEVTNGSFLVRNEMLASLVDMLIVIEAPARSGTLHTVKYAMKMNKPVAVFPANIFSFSSEGSNRLLTDRSVNVLYSREQIERILDGLCCKLKLSGEVNKGRSEVKMDPMLTKTLHILSAGAITLDELNEKLGLSTNLTCKMLTKLEIEGIVKTDKLGHIRLL